MKKTKRRADEAKLNVKNQNLVYMSPYHQTGDVGKDNILRKDGVIHLVECKRYKENNKVSQHTNFIMV